MLNSQKKENQSVGETCLAKMLQTLEIRHLCPTAPDTLRIHPFKNSDPFVIVA
jgi:DNA polymerase II small subunit/DNA polymerase delta subunit B